MIWSYSRLVLKIVMILLVVIWILNDTILIPTIGIYDIFTILLVRPSDILICSSILLIVMLTISVILSIVTIIIIVVLVVIFVFLLVALSLFVITIRLLALRWVLVIRIDMMSRFISCEAIILTLVWSWRIVLVITTRVKWLGLAWLMTATSANYIIWYILFVFIFITHHVVHIVLPNCVGVCLRHLRTIHGLWFGTSILRLLHLRRYWSLRILI